MSSTQEDGSLKPGDEESRHGRLSGLPGMTVLLTKRISVIGCGSMGQPAASQFVRHGIGTQPPGRIRMVDGDHISWRNLIGTDYREEHIGRPKAEVAAELLREIDHNVNVSYWNRHLEEQDIPAVVTMAQQSDLLVLAADSFELMLEIAEQCADICPQVMAVFGPNADYAEVAFSVPGSTPSLKETMGKRKREPLSKPSALGTDTACVANFVATVCLSLLLGEAGEEVLPCYPESPLFLVGQRRKWLFANQPEQIVKAVLRVRSHDPGRRR